MQLVETLTNYELERGKPMPSKSCWLVQPTLKTIALFTPVMDPQVYTTGDVTDPVTGITVNIEDIFKS